MDVELVYFEGCPHWQTAAHRLQRVADEHAATVRQRCVTNEESDRSGFAGSPTILINGRDPFPGGTPARALSCRLYQTPEGSAGSPTIEQIRAVMEHVRAIDTRTHNVSVEE